MLPRRLVIICRGVHHSCLGGGGHDEYRERGWDRLAARPLDCCTLGMVLLLHNYNLIGIRLFILHTMQESSFNEEDDDGEEQHRKRQWGVI